MLGRKERDQLELFITGSLRQLVPDDHILARVDRVLDLSWLRDEVADLYCTDNGRPGIDPEVAVRLMVAGFLLGIIHDRRLLREAQVNLAIRWFVGYGLHEVLPDHSSLTRIRQRWGAERFRNIFKRTVKACIAARIATGEIVHIDASLIRANVSWDALAGHHVADVEAANPSEFEWEDRQSGKYKKICTTDPDATMATNGRNRRLEPSYKQHTAVDDVKGVVVDVEVTTGEENEGMAVEAQLDAIAMTTGVAIKMATMDAGYAYAKVFRALEDRQIDAIVPAKAERRPGKVIPTRRFRLDAKHNLVRCPTGKILRPKGKLQRGSFQHFHASREDCRACPLRPRCVSPSRHARVVVFNINHPSLLRARRKRLRWGNHEHHFYRRHRWRVEGLHGEAKTWHGLARAIRRGRDNMRIQAFLTAAAVNLKRLAAALFAILLVFAPHVNDRIRFQRIAST
ncbi:IS1182 family transposase [Bradyrhizobium retamae]|uniref:Transposase n=1 Tax=Bradyrhizobium retamae TaxID=1300035 RepID=A0A0R3MI47_9BRAD|nr:IS1182 family transposase [Bradyrhizobium retamae]KRR17743.1 transposase [Bradyrhizobium retamae]